MRGLGGGKGKGGLSEGATGAGGKRFGFGWKGWMDGGGSRERRGGSLGEGPGPFLLSGKEGHGVFWEPGVKVGLSLQEGGASAGVTGVLGVRTATDAAWGVVRVTDRGGMGGAGADGTCFATRAVGFLVAIKLALVASNWLFEVFVGGGKVVVNSDSFDEESVGCFRGG